MSVKICVLVNNLLFLIFKFTQLIKILNNQELHNFNHQILNNYIQTNGDLINRVCCSLTRVNLKLAPSYFFDKIFRKIFLVNRQFQFIPKGDSASTSII